MRLFEYVLTDQESGIKFFTDGKIEPIIDEEAAKLGDELAQVVFGTRCEEQGRFDEAIHWFSESYKQGCENGGIQYSLLIWKQLTWICDYYYGRKTIDSDIYSCAKKYNLINRQNCIEIMRAMWNDCCDINSEILQNTTDDDTKRTCNIAIAQIHLLNDPDYAVLLPYSAYVSAWYHYLNYKYLEDQRSGNMLLQINKDYQLNLSNEVLREWEKDDVTIDDWMIKNGFWVIE